MTDHGTVRVVDDVYLHFQQVLDVEESEIHSHESTTCIATIDSWGKGSSESSPQTLVLF